MLEGATMNTEKQELPLSVVAVVEVSDREALVLNRPLQLAYKRVGNDYIGSDGPFRSLLYFEKGGGRFVAFAGRELALPMKNGTIHTVKDHWWSGTLKGHASVITADVESLKQCYVFGGGMCAAPEELAALRATYTGCVYPYWDYEKVIKFDDMRRDLWKRIAHEEKRSRALTNVVKEQAAQLKALGPGQKLCQMEKHAQATVARVIELAAVRHLHEMATGWRQ
jgi:hypothetical protein